MRDWTNQAIRKIEADCQRSADTRLIKRAVWGLTLSCD